MSIGRVDRLQRKLATDEGGVAAVEFAILLPLMMVLFFAGITIVNVVNVSRKITITTRALADLTSQYVSMKQTDMTTVMNASAQILAPYSNTPLGMRISEFYVTITNHGLSNTTACTVTWSSAQGLGMSAYKSGAGSTCTVPASMIPAPIVLNSSVSVYLIYAETSYAYVTPFSGIGRLNMFGIQWIPSTFGTYALGDRIFMLPRLSTSVAYSGS